MGCNGVSRGTGNYQANQTYYWDGWDYPSTYPTSDFPGLLGKEVAGQGDSPTFANGEVLGGVQADITTYANYWNGGGGGDGFDWQWVMLDNDLFGSVSSGANWAQVGPMTGDFGYTQGGVDLTYALTGDSGTTDDSVIMAQWTSGGQATWLVPTYQTNPTEILGYETLYNQTDGEFSMEYEDSSGWNMVKQIDLNWTDGTGMPSQADVNGETHDVADQMYGDLNTSEPFDNSEVYVDTGGHDYGNWEAFDSGWTSSNGPYSGQATMIDYSTTNGGTSFNTQSDLGFDIGSTEDLNIVDVGCPVSAGVKGQSGLTDGTPYNVLDASGRSLEDDLESVADGTHNSPFYLEAQWASTGNFFEKDSSGRLLWTPGIDTTDPTFSIMQHDCNYVIYDAWGQKSLFSTGTNGDGAGCYLVMQSDGNLDLYTSGGTLKWSNYAGWDSSYVNSTNSALLYGGTLTEGHVLWDPTGTYELRMQSDGNLVLYEYSGGTYTAKWTTGTSNASGCTNFLNMQASDGNLVEYEDCSGTNTALWNAGTSGTGTFNHMLVNPQGTISVQEVTQTGNQNAWQS